MAGRMEMGSVEKREREVEINWLSSPDGNGWCLRLVVLHWKEQRERTRGR
jgi:hypothetical protein